MSPDGSTKPLPEERLLKLIRGKGPKAAEPAAPRHPSSTPGRAATDALETGGRGQALRWSRFAVWGLGVALGLELIALIVQAARPMPTVQAPAIPAPSGEVEPLPPLEIPSLAASVSRPVFASPGVASPSGAPQPRSGAAKQLAERLTLMGIVAGNPPQAIIEDAQTKKSYFVTTGQTIAEGAVVEQVLDNRVILNLLGEKIELSL